MSDDKVTFRVDSDTKQHLDANDNLNTSGLMRSLLTNYVRMGDVVEASLERRLKNKENDLERKRLEKAKIESDIERLEREVDDIQDKIKERRNSVPDEVIKFADRIENGNFTREQLDPENPATKNWAQKAGVPPEQFVNYVKDQL